MIWLAGVGRRAPRQPRELPRRPVQEGSFAFRPPKRTLGGSMRGEGLCNLNDHYPTNVRLCWGPHGAWFRANSFALQPFSNRFGRRSGALWRWGRGLHAPPEAVTPSPLGSICARHWGDPAAAPNSVPAADVLLGCGGNHGGVR